MSQFYKIEQGDYLPQIAAKFGFTDFTTIWDHAKNAQLKQKRKNPNVLFPGDILFIPDKQDKQEARPTTQRHVFQVAGQTVTLRLALEDSFEEPIANARCDLKIEDTLFQLTSTGSGRLEKEIPVAAHAAELVIRDEQTPVHDLAIPIKIGHLDPVDEVSGQVARLNNLGYNVGVFDASAQSTPDPDAQNRFLSAVEEFQCDHHLAVDGKCGPQTQAKLKEVHGC